MDYNTIRNALPRFLPRFILNGMDFVEGMCDAVHYTYVDKGFWHEAGYGLTYAITGWWSETRDRYRERNNND